MNSSNDKVTLGNRLRELRLAKRVTHAGLASAAGISRSYVTRLESDRVELPRKRTLLALARALDTTPEDLLSAAGYLPPLNREPGDTGLEIAFRLVQTLPKQAQDEVLDYVARISRVRPSANGTDTKEPALQS